MVVKFWHSFQIVDNSKVLKLWGVLWDFIQFQKETSPISYCLRNVLSICHQTVIHPSRYYELQCIA